MENPETLERKVIGIQISTHVGFVKTTLKTLGIYKAIIIFIWFYFEEILTTSYKGAFSFFFIIITLLKLTCISLQRYKS